jgi:predicted amino acid racemase
LIREFGATHAEPGNALTGTTPLHALRDQPEIPALIHVSEISHRSNDMAYCYGGGLYRRSIVDKALVGNDVASLKEARVVAPDNTAIDYYVGLKPAAKNDFQVGDSVLWSSRAQIFVTRSSVAIISGIQSRQPVLNGIFNPFGQKVAQ